MSEGVRLLRGDAGGTDSLVVWNQRLAIGFNGLNGLTI